MILKPFMLRRVKTEVENELTDKIEVRLENTWSDANLEIKLVWYLITPFHLHTSRMFTDLLSMVGLILCHYFLFVRPICSFLFHRL